MKLDKGTDKSIVSGPSRGRGPHISLERRIHPRLPAVDFRVWLGWWSVESEFSMIAARFENISRGGALIVSPRAVEFTDEVWLKLGAAEYPDCVRAEVLDASPTDGGDQVVRLRFPEGCPDRFFEVVTRGLLLSGRLGLDEAP